jgi:predicted outer membrane repeat protein
VLEKISQRSERFDTAHHTQQLNSPHQTKKSTDSGAGTLRDALAAAAADPAGPHTVVMSPSLGSSATITLTAALSLPNSNITVDGTLSGGARVTISGAGAGGGYTYASIGVHELGHSIGFNTADFVDIGLDVASNELALTNVSLTSTRPLADNLKALVVNNARAALRNVRIEGFTIGGSNIGAAIVLYDSAELDAADLTVARCRSVDGAAILTSGSTPTIACQRCAFLDNESSRNGGAVCLYGGRAVFDRSLFTENSGNTGGAVYISGAPGPVTVTRTYFDSNEAGLGGAIYAASTYLAVRNSAAVNNTASLSGAGLYLSNAFFDLHSVTALNNRAQNGPNNFFTVPSDGSRVSTITNSVYYDALDNIALSGIVYGSSVRLTDNIIKGYNDTATCPETGICATGTVDADPQLVQVVEAQPDNSPVDTFWVPSSGCSPAVNTGDNTGGDAVDMRGDARVVGAAVDRGAVEYAPSRSSNRAALVTGAAAYAVAAGSQLTVAAATGLLSNASDPDCDALTASLVSPPSPAGSGAVTVSPDGSFVFTPAAGFAGTATFVFAVSDGALSTQATARVNVIAAPPAPANNAQSAFLGGGAWGRGLRLCAYGAKGILTLMFVHPSPLPVTHAYSARLPPLLSHKPQTRPRRRPRPRPRCSPSSSRSA